MRPRGLSFSFAVSRYVGQAAVHRPQWTQSRNFSYSIVEPRRGRSDGAGVAGGTAVGEDIELGYQIREWDSECKRNRGRFSRRCRVKTAATDGDRKSVV